MITEATTAPIERRIGERVRSLRASLGLSLDALALRSGVGRSTISLIERGESSPTAVVLEKLAGGLGVPLAALFEAAGTAASPVARAAAQPPWRDPGSGYLRRNVSPAGHPSPLRIVDVQFPPGASVAYEAPPQGPAWHQQVWVLDGRIEVSVGDTRHRLDAGDCLAMRLDAPVAFHNPTRRAARYAVVLAPAVWN